MLYYFPAHTTFNVIQVEDRFYAEESRTHHYLSSYTFGPLRKILEDYLLTSNLSSIISMPNSGLDVMIDADKREDLSRLYRLFIMVPTGLSTLRKALRDSIIRRGKELAAASGSGGANVADEGEIEDDKGKGKVKAIGGAVQTLQVALKWVQDVLDLKDKFNAVWVQAFRGDREIETGINEARNIHASITTFVMLLSRRLRPSSISMINLPSSSLSSLMRTSRKG